MAEISSSQESLPLSQETFANIWSRIPPNIQELINLGNFAPIPTENSSEIPCSEQLIAAMSDIQIPCIERNSTQSSVPNTDDFPGFFNFSVSLPDQKDLGKNSPFVYSTLNKRLYVQKDVPCPFHFSTNQPLTGNYEIRAMLYFGTTENVSEVVVRCVNHSFKDKESGDIYYEHLIRSNSQTAIYFKDADTTRCSVTVPFEDPPIGQNYSTYLFKFTCYTSCAGGPNRRPMCIVFTLENKGLILGRCKVDLKVCSFPFRDKKMDEKNIVERNTDDAPVQPNPLPIKRKRETVKESGFVVTVNDEECYKLLNSVKIFYEMKKMMAGTSNWVPTVKDIANLLHVLTSSDEDKADN